MEEDIVLDVKSFDQNEVKLNLKGFYFFNQNKYYFVTLNHCFSICSALLNGKIRKRFTNCLWNEILFLNSLPDKNQFVFKNFLVKQIDPRVYYKFSDGTLKFQSNEYFPIGMLPNNPRNLYYKMEIISGKINVGNSGSPVYDSKENLIGIISKNTTKYVYIIPIIYLIKSLSKKDNKNIYSVELDKNIRYINNYKINSSNKIYYNSMNSYLPIDCYLNLITDKNKKILVKNKLLMEKILKSKIYENNILNSFDYIVNINNIKLTSSLLRYLKEINENQIIRNLHNIFNKKEFFVSINDKSFKVVY